MGCHLQLRWYPPLLFLYRWFNKASVAHLLVNSATEPSTDGTGFYFNVFMVHKHTDGIYAKPNHM